MTQAEFKKLVVDKVAGGMLYAMALYQAMDETIAGQPDRRQFVCRKGCHFCCKQIVTTTFVGAEAISMFIKRMPQKDQRQMFGHARSRVEDYVRWFQHNRSSGNILDPLWLAEQWFGKPCPFLSARGTCWIYPVRPMDCRTMYSSSPCTSFERRGGATRMPHECQRWANSMMLEEQQRRGGRMEVVPLPHWLWVCFSAP